MENTIKRINLIKSVLDYCNYPKYYAPPEIVFWFPYTWIKVKFPKNNRISYSKVLKLTNILEELNITNINIIVDNDYLITIKGLDTEKIAEQLHCLLQIKGILK